MISRILSVAAPLWVYVTLAVLVLGIWRARKKLEWFAVAPALAGVLTSALFLPPDHRLFYDEDIYINIASNLAHLPVAQLTLVGSPGDVEVSTYYKEPAGWPVLLSLIFLFTGPRETAAFVVARILFGLAIAAVYHLALEFLRARSQALTAAILFGAAPACFWFSVSPGTDVPAALMTVLGVWGLVSGNGALAAGGLAMASQTRLELIALMPLLWINGKISLKWKAAGALLVIAEAAHVVWVMSVSPILAEADYVSSGFALEYVRGNLLDNIKYLLNPASFAAGATALAIWAAARRRFPALLLQIGAVFPVYLLFYAGSFDLNPRYSIQILAPLAVLAASVVRRPLYIGILILSLAVPFVQPREFAGYLEALAADHRFSVQFAEIAGENDVVVSASPQVFMNHGRRAMDAVFASTRRDKLEEELRSRERIFYHSGARANRLNSPEAVADRWMKSNFELHLIDSRQISGLQIAFFEVLPKPVDGKAR